MRMVSFNKTKRLSRKEQPFYIFYSRRFYFRCNYFSQADCNLQPLIQYYEKHIYITRRQQELFNRKSLINV